MSTHTESDQRADTAFLVGVAYGRRAQAEEIAQAIEAVLTNDPLVADDLKFAANIARESV